MTPRDFIVRHNAIVKTERDRRQFQDQLVACQTARLGNILAGSEDNPIPYQPDGCRAFVWDTKPAEVDGDDDDDTFGRIMDSHVRMNKGRFNNHV